MSQQLFIRVIQLQDERDRLKAANAELAKALRTIAEFDQWEWTDRESVRVMRCNARAALTKHQGATA